MPHRFLRLVLFLPFLGMLSGCKLVLMSPSGDVALQQRNLILVSTGLMLLIVIPVILLTLVFAWHYRQSNTEAAYDPDWHHSTQLEVVIWAAPLVIIVALGALTWIGSHLLDPFRPIERISADKPVIPANVKPLVVEVVALDWKWLFVYPDLGIASLNEMAAPVDVPIDFRITASSVMNSFFIPALAGQIYAMPGMQTQLHAVINKPGEFRGFSANYSGAGFSDMHFAFHGLSGGDFDKWIQTVKSGGGTLSRDAYLQLERPSEREPVRYFGVVEPNLFGAILNMCVDRSKTCIHEMSSIDRRGMDPRDDARSASANAFQYDRFQLRGGDPRLDNRTIAAICTTTDSSGAKSAQADLEAPAIN